MIEIYGGDENLQVAFSKENQVSDFIKQVIM